ncbi:hypothetical protein [Priestia endophytica]|uniref:Uncharacterized protein n=1 Tax=Priestia endophytica DSM 13796 TaxID=1121089 RepID=A0A1I5YNI3_9BACI|nr:hypothetical protein [Priestia endophytica]KYG33640.1 hypothetical protein AZF06_21200 [Priestia endophytica]SFQ45796.1 hypothetical protein SAMN02745910_01445 [Priestia endophytica DSM 13796]
MERKKIIGIISVVCFIVSFILTIGRYATMGGWIPYGGVFVAIFLNYVLPFLGFLASFFSERGFLKYVGIYGNLLIIILTFVIPIITLIFWFSNPIP